MILTWLGRSFLYVAFAGALFGALLQLRALRTKNRSFAMAFAGLALAGILGAVGVMQYALVTHDFALAYVAENNATFTPLLYSITGMWSALEGSLLLWSLLLAAITLGVLFYYRREKSEPVVGWAAVVLFLVGAFFTALMMFPADPFLHNPAHVLQGQGPNALLQDNPLVAVHPPLLYLGFVGFTVPFAFAIAMLITGRVHERWPLEQRRWTVTATAYIHSVIVQDRRGLFRVWNLSLAIATFSLTVLGTFFTRSGVLESVHSFSSSTLGPLLIGLFFFTIALGVGLLAWRGDALRSPVGVDQPLSREGLFVANNILFVGFALVVLLGTVFPLLYEAVNGTQVTVGTPYFATIAAPLSVVLLALMALAPLVSWRSASRVVLWNRLRLVAWASLVVVAVLVALGVRHPAVLVAVFFATAAAGAALRTLYGVLVAAHRRGRLRGALRAPSTGGMVVHLGIVVLAIGIVVSTSYTQRSEVTLASGQSTVVDSQFVSFAGFHVVKDALETATQLVVTVDGHALRPAVTTFHGRATTVGTPAIDSNLLRDVYVTFDAVGGNGTTSGAQVQNNLPAGSVVLGVTVEPLLAWLWIGGLMVGLGAGLSFLRRRHVEEPTS